MSLFALGPGAALEAAELGTPAFIYDLDVAEASFLRLRAALPPRVRLAYAVKANPHPAILGLFAGLGASFDCASSGELERMTRAGVPGSRVLFAGPGKSRAELGAALALGARIECDGIEDLERLDAILGEREAAGGEPSGRPLAVSLRVHPASGVVEGSRIIGGTGPSAFGVDEEDLAGFVLEARRFGRLGIRGLQVFASSNERSAGRLLSNHRAAMALGRRLEELAGEPLDCIDLGGGLGIPYSVEEAELDVEALGRGLSELLDDNNWFKGELVLEPGRFLAGPCGVYLARVLRVKESRGKRFAVLEGGINHLLRPLLTGSPFPVRSPSAELRAAGRGDRRRIPQVLAGPLCSSLDRLGEIELPPLEAGDLLVFGQAGAYGFTEAMQGFLSHPPAAESCARGGRVLFP
jgi:diaminopimelate decarboxylase